MIRLSICIATFNRAKFISETLDSILCQMQSGVELIVVEGASPDNTQEVMERYVSKYPDIRYYREAANSGIDGDYDKAVGYAAGEYCWLMTDDDLMQPGAIQKVLSKLTGQWDLVVVNAEVRNSDLSETLVTRQLKADSDRIYERSTTGKLFSECMNYLSFIGGVVIRRDVWQARQRVPYYGSLFIHAGVIFQTPVIENVYVIATPYIVIRYGNAMWTSRGFEIWAFKWPEFVWAFPSFDDVEKRKVCPKAPWRRIKTLFYSRATGAYTQKEFELYIRDRALPVYRLTANLISRFPAKLSNFISVFYFALFNRTERMMQYDLLRSQHASWLSRSFAKLLWK